MTEDKTFLAPTFRPKHFKFNENATLKEVIEMMNLIGMTANDRDMYNKLKEFKWLTFEEVEDDRG